MGRLMSNDIFNYFMRSYYNQNYNRKDFENCLLDFRKNEENDTVKKLLKDFIYIRNTKKIAENFDDESIYTDMFWKKYDNVLTLIDIDLAINFFSK